MLWDSWSADSRLLVSGSKDSTMKVHLYLLLISIGIFVFCFKHVFLLSDPLLGDFALFLFLF